MTTKTAAYITFNKGECTQQMLYTSRLSDGNAYMMARMVSPMNPNRKWRVRITGSGDTISRVATYFIDAVFRSEFVSLNRPLFADLTDADEADFIRLAVPQNLLRRLSGAPSNVEGTTSTVTSPDLGAERTLIKRRFETIIDGVPEGSTFVSWLLEQDAE